MKDFDVYVPPYNPTIIYPLQKSFYACIMVVNKGDEVMEFNLQGRLPELEGVITRGNKSPPLTPQWVLRLEPGESRPVTYIMNEEFIFPRTGHGAVMDRAVQRMSLKELKGEQERTVIVNVVPRDDRSKAKTVTLKHVIRVVSPEMLENSTVQGYICDEKGKPIQNIPVILRGKSNVYKPSGKTDENGFYSIKCYGQYPYQIEAEVKGYKWFHRDIEPPWLGPMRVDVSMEKLDGLFDYELVKKHDLAWGNGCIGWMSRNEKYVFIGFRAGRRGGHGEGVVESHVYLFTIDGELLWKQPMKGAVWTLDVSDDGSLASAAGLGLMGEGLRGEGQEIVLFDGAGNVLWRKEGIHCRESRISHNNKYVAAQGDDSFRESRHVFLLDASNGDLIWKKDTAGQVRVIFWSEDDSKIYVFSGSGYLDTFDIEGNLLWRAYIGTWPEHRANVDITSDDELIATSGHWGEINLIDKNGQILWSRYATGYIYGQTSIAPDKSYVVVASTGEYGLVKFDLEGNMLWRKGSADCCRVTGDSENILYSFHDTYLLDRDGSVLWTYPIRASIKFSEITKDKSRIVVADQSGKIYFFKRKE